MINISSLGSVVTLCCRVWSFSSFTALTATLVSCYSFFLSDHDQPHVLNVTRFANPMHSGFNGLGGSTKPWTLFPFTLKLLRKHWSYMRGPAVVCQHEDCRVSPSHKRTFLFWLQGPTFSGDCQEALGIKAEMLQQLFEDLLDGGAPRSSLALSQPPLSRAAGSAAASPASCQLFSVPPCLQNPVSACAKTH